VKAIGLDIANGHALRDVESDDRVERRDWGTPRRLADLGTDERDHDEEAARPDKDQLGDLPRGARRCEARAGTGERGERAAPPYERNRAESHDQDGREQQRRELDRIRTLHTSEAASQAQLDAANTRVSSAQAALAAAEAKLGLAKLALRNASVAAPFDGLVARRFVSAGDHVSEGEKLFDLVALEVVGRRSFG